MDLLISEQVANSNKSLSLSHMFEGFQNLVWVFAII